MKNGLCAPAAPFLLALALQASPAFPVNLAEGTWLVELAPSVCAAAPPTPRSMAPEPGMQVYRDPGTGRFTVPPPSKRPPKVVERRAQPLVERAVTVPAGGVRVDVSDRFATAFVVHRDADGRLHFRCSLHSATPVARGYEHGGER